MVQKFDGVQIIFSVSGFVSEVVSAEWSDIERESINVSVIDQVNSHTFCPASFTSPGILSAELHFNPDQRPPIAGAPELISVWFPTGSGGFKEWRADGFISEYIFNGELKGKLVADVKIKMSGSVNIENDLEPLINDDFDIISNDDGEDIYAA